MESRTSLCGVMLFALVTTAGGCAAKRPGVSSATVGPARYYEVVGLTHPTPVPSVLAECDPPDGWIAQPLRQSEKHTHQIWLSPTGKTAYGVMHFRLPLPVGVSLAHWGFLQEMKKKEGEAIEISEKMDPALPGMRFVCEGGRYKMRVNMTVRGFDGWAAYAGTLRQDVTVPAELELAERARENTVFGLPDGVATAKRPSAGDNTAVSE